MNYDFLKKAKLPILLLAVLILPLFIGPFVPVGIKSTSYALSLSMKSLLEFLLPFIIFSFVFSCLSNLEDGAIFFVVLLVSCVFISNFTALFVGYASGTTSLSLFHVNEKIIPNNIEPLTPLWHFTLHKWISNDWALIAGFITGIFFSIRPQPYAKKLAFKLNSYAHGFLKHIFIPLLPFFVLGFVFKLEHEETLKRSLTIYGPILIVIISTQWLYLLSWYYTASNFSIKRCFTYLKNVFPASLTGLSTISSAASMPVLLLSTEKNLDDPKKAQMLVPAIINIHTIGSAIAIPILALATMSSFGMSHPNVSTFLVFAFFTALAKFAVAAVPGGVVIVVAPLLEKYLGFSGEMTGIVTAIYMICDPFGTTANVTGNGVFPIIFSKLHAKLLQIKLVQRLHAS